MDYKRFDDTIYARIDRGEEILAALKRIAEQEEIELAEISGLGGLRAFSVGTFEADRKRYVSHEYAGDFEMIALTGTVSTMDGAFYAHLHLCAAGADGAAVGGHLTRADVGVTAEITIRITKGRVERTRDEAIGVNLWNFGK